MIHSSAVRSDGVWQVSAGEIFSGATVGSGESAVIHAGASASDITVSGGGYVVVSGLLDGGSVDGLAYSGGSIVVENGGGVRGVVINSGGMLTVSRGAIAQVDGYTPGVGTINTLLGGHVLHDPPLAGCYLLSDGVLISSVQSIGARTLNAGEELLIGAGGYASNISAHDGASIVLYPQGSADAVRVYAHGFCAVYSDAHLSSMSLENGSMYIYNGGSALNLAWSAGGALYGIGALYAELVNQSTGCIVYWNDDRVTHHDHLPVDPRTPPLLTSAYAIYIRSGGVASSLDYPRSMTVHISSGGSVVGAILPRYDDTVASSSDSHKRDYSDEAEFEAMMASMDAYLSGTDEDSDRIEAQNNSYTKLLVSSGGKVEDITVYAGSVTLLSGGSLSGAYSVSYGCVQVSSGGSAYDVRLRESGTLLVEGLVSGAQVYSSASASVLAGSLATPTVRNAFITVSGGVVEDILADSVARITMVSGAIIGGTLVSAMALVSGGMVDGLEVNSQARLYASSDVVLSGVTAGSGGCVIIQPGCDVTGLLITPGAYLGGFYWGHSGLELTDFSSDTVTVMPGVTVGSTELVAASNAHIPVLSVISPGKAHLLSGADVALACVKDGGYLYLSSGAVVHELAVEDGFLGVTSDVQYSSEVEMETSSYEDGIWLYDSALVTETWTETENYPVVAGSIGTLAVMSDTTSLTVISGAGVGHLELRGGTVTVSGGSVGSVLEDEGYFKVVDGAEPSYVKHTQHYPTFAGKSVTIHSNTYAKSPVVSSKGLLEIFSSGYASDVKVARGGSVYLHSGARVRKLHEMGGVVLIDDYSALTDVTFNSTPVKQLLMGFRRSCTLHSGTIFEGAVVSMYGSALVYSGGVFTGDKGFGNIITQSAYVAGSMARIFVSGGTMAYTVIDGYGKAFISDDGLVSNCSVKSLGELSGQDFRMLHAGIYTGGSATVGSGGYAADVDVTGSDSLLVVSNCGYVYNNRISNLGILTVGSGGSALALRVQSGGTLTICSGGSAEGTLLGDSSGKIVVSGGGTVTHLILNVAGASGAVTVESGGSLTLAHNPWRPSLPDELEAYVSDGGMVSSATGAMVSLTSAGAWLGNHTYGVVAGGLRLQDLTAENGLAAGNGLSAIVSSGGEIVSAEVLSSGLMTVYDGGSASAVSAAGGGKLHISGYASSRYGAGSCWWYALISGGVCCTSAVTDVISSRNDSLFFSDNSALLVSGNSWQWSLSGSSKVVSSAVDFSVTSIIGHFSAGNGVSSVTADSAMLLTISSGGVVTTVAPSYYKVNNAGDSIGFSQISGSMVVSSAVSSSTVSTFTKTYLPGVSVWVENIYGTDPETGSPCVISTITHVDTGTWVAASTFMTRYTTSFGLPQAGEDADIGSLLLYHGGSLYRSARAAGGTLHSGLVVFGGIAGGGYPITTDCVLSRTPVTITSTVESFYIGSTFHIGSISSSLTIPSAGSAPYWGYMLCSGALVSSSFTGINERTWVVDHLTHHPNGGHVVKSGTYYTGGSMLVSHGMPMFLYLSGFSDLVATSTVFVDDSSPHYECITYIPVKNNNGITEVGTTYRLVYAEHPLPPETCRMSGVEIERSGEVFVSAGVVTDMMIRSGGTGRVDECGTVLNATVNAGGTLYLGHTGSATIAYNPWQGTVVSRPGAVIDYLDSTFVYVGGSKGLTSSGEYMSGITVDRGDEMLVYSSGVVNDIVVNGTLNVSAGGTATVAFNPWSGSVVVSEGASVTALDRTHKIYIGGNNYGLVSKTDVLEREYQIVSKHVVLVYSGGTMEEATVSVGGLGVLSGGTLFDPAISAYGKVGVYSGGLLDSARVFSSGLLIVSNSGIASAVFMNGGVLRNEVGGYVEISYNPWGSAAYEGGPEHRMLGTYEGEGTVVYPDDRMPCYYGCPEDGVVSRSEDAFWVLNFKNADFNEPRSALIYSGGSLIRTTVEKSGLALIDSSGYAISTTLKNSGRLEVSGGFATSTVVSATGSYSVSAGGIVSNVTAYGSDAPGYVLSGGAVDYAVLSGAPLFVNAGGTASRIINYSDAVMHISSGGTADRVEILSEASVYVSSGALVVSGALRAGGSMTLSSGGTALSLDWTPTVGTFDIAIGGAVVTFADNVSGVYVGVDDELLSHVNNLGSVLLGEASSAFVMQHGYMYDCTLDGGVTYIWSGGHGSGITVLTRGDRSGYPENDTDGTIEYDPVRYDTATMSSLALYVLSGASVDAVSIRGGGVMVYSGGSVVSTTLDGGFLALSSGCRAGYTYVSNGDYDINSGTYAEDTMEVGGYAHAFSGGTANSVTVSGGTFTVRSGGTALAIVENGGFVDVRDGADARFTPHMFHSSGFHNRGITLHSGTTAVSMQISSACSVFVFSSGSAVDITVHQNRDNQPALFTIYDGGVVSSALLWRERASAVVSGGTLTDAIVSQSAALIVSGGDVSSVMLCANATLLQSGGTISATTIGAYAGYGATATIYDGTASLRESGGCVLMSGGTVTFEPCVFSGMELSGGSVTVHSGTTGVSLTSPETELYYHVFSGGVLSDVRVPIGVSVFVDSDAAVYAIKESGGYVETTSISAGMFAQHETAEITFADSTYFGHKMTLHSGVSVGVLTFAAPMASAYIYSAAVVGSLMQGWGDTGAGEYPTYIWAYAGASIGSAIVSGMAYAEEYEGAEGLAPELHLSGALVDFASATHSGTVYVYSGASVLTALTNMSGVFHVYPGGFVGREYNPFMPGGGEGEDLEAAGYYDHGGSIGVGVPHGVYYGSGNELLEHSATFSGQPFDTEYPSTPFALLSSGYSMFVYDGGTATDILVNAGADFRISGGTATLRHNPWMDTISNVYRIASGSEYIENADSTSPITSAGGSLVSAVLDSTGIYYGGMSSRMYISGGLDHETVSSYCNNHIATSTSVDRDGMTHSTTIYYGCDSDRIEAVNYASTRVYSSGDITYSGKVIRGPLLSRIASGNSANGTWPMSGGSLLVYAGGILNNFTAQGGFTHIYSSGLWLSGVVRSAHYYQEIFYSGELPGSKQYRAGEVFVSVGGVVSRVTANSRGILHICSGGSGINIAISCTRTGGNSYLYVEPFGYVNGLTVGAFGIASAAAVVSSIKVEDNGSAYLISGCTLASATVKSGGLMVVSSGVDGAAIDLAAGAKIGGFSWDHANEGLTVTDGVLTIASGVTILAEHLTVSSAITGSFTIDAPGTAHVLSDGTVSSVWVSEGGSLCVESDGRASGVELEGTFSCGMTVSSGGSGESILVKRNGFLVVADGGTASGIVESGGHVEVMPEAAAQFTPMVLSNFVWRGRSGYGYAGIKQSATLHSDTVLSGGKVENCYLSAVNASVYAASITDGGTVSAYGQGAFVSGAVLSYGKLIVSSGASAINPQMLGGARLEVYDRGSALNVINNSGGWGNNGEHDEINVYSGGVMSGFSGAPVMHIHSGGSVENAVFTVDSNSKWGPNNAHWGAEVSVYGGGVLRSCSILNLYDYGDSLTHVLREDAGGKYLPISSTYNGLRKNTCRVYSGGCIEHVWLDGGNNISVFSGGTALNVSTLHQTINTEPGAVVTYAALTYESMAFVNSDHDIYIHTNTVISSAFFGSANYAHIEGEIKAMYPISGPEVFSATVYIHSGGLLHPGATNIACTYVVSAGGCIDGDLGIQPNLTIDVSGSGGVLIARGTEHNQDVDILKINGSVGVLSCVPRSNYTVYISLGGTISALYAYAPVSITGTGTVSSFYAPGGAVIVSNGVSVTSIS